MRGWRISPPSSVKRFRVDSRSRVLQAATPGFDVMVLEVLLAHANGAALVVSPPEVFAGAELAELIRTQRVSHAFVTPSVLATMSPAGLDSLQVLVAGGEAVSPETVAVWAPGRAAVQRVRTDRDHDPGRDQ